MYLGIFPASTADSSSVVPYIPHRVNLDDDGQPDPTDQVRTPLCAMDEGTYLNTGTRGRHFRALGNPQTHR